MATGKSVFCQIGSELSLAIGEIDNIGYGTRWEAGSAPFDVLGESAWPLPIEMRFAHLKVQHGFERMRLRGLTGARDEFHLAAIVQNLKTMALRLLGPPADAVCASIA
jgi:hypothetical protein